MSVVVRGGSLSPSVALTLLQNGGNIPDHMNLIPASEATSDVRGSSLSLFAPPFFELTVWTAQIKYLDFCGTSGSCNVATGRDPSQLGVTLPCATSRVEPCGVAWTPGPFNDTRMFFIVRCVLIVRRQSTCELHCFGSLECGTMRPVFGSFVVQRRIYSDGAYLSWFISQGVAPGRVTDRLITPGGIRYGPRGLLSSAECSRTESCSIVSGDRNSPFDSASDSQDVRPYRAHLNADHLTLRAC